MVTVASSLRSSKPDDLPGYELREKSEKEKIQSQVIRKKMNLFTPECKEM